MKLAVLSDIHGNDIAFEACLSYLKQQDIDAYCLLGDYIGELPGIRHTMEMLYRLMEEECCYIIRGNKEEYQLGSLVEEHPEWDAYPSTVGMLRYGKTQLQSKDLDFLKRLPISRIVRIEGLPELMLCHGSPRNVREDLYAHNEKNGEIFKEIKQIYILSGHTHRTTSFEEHGKLVFNPGAVGLPVHGAKGAQIMILHGDRGSWVPEFLTIDYAVEDVIREMHQKHLYEIAPYWTRITEWMLRGADSSHGSLLAQAMELCTRKYGRCQWPMIPEECWQEVYERFMAAKDLPV